MNSDGLILPLGGVLIALILLPLVIGALFVISFYGGKGNNGTVYASETCTSADIPSGALANINKNMSVYKQAGEAVDIPWEMIAGMHFRETTNSRTTPKHNSGDGVYQILTKNYPYPAGKELDDAAFLIETIDAANFLKGKSRPKNFGGEKLTQETTNIELIKDTFFGYNGRAKVYGSPDGSPYVMNNFDAAHKNMPIITKDGGGVDGIDTRNGAYTTLNILKGGCK